MTQPAGYKALRKGRFARRGGAYLVTFVTHHRHPWFRDFETGRLLCRQLCEAAPLLHVGLLAWVVMPDHVHLLLKLDGARLAKPVQRLKAGTARDINRLLSRSGRFWQPGFHERALRRNRDLRRAARYIVANPLRSGLVARVGDYPFWDSVWLGARAGSPFG